MEPRSEDPRLGEVAERVLAARAPAGTTTVVAVAGPVAVGKSTLALALAAALGAAGAPAEVVSTDGFLLPTAVLEARGILLRKGFPESYDLAALEAFLAAARTDPVGLPVPEYSHETYDVVAEPTRALGPVAVLVLEGVNALSATTGSADLGVYVHAPDDVVEAWYVERFRALCDRPPPDSFFSRFAGMGARDQEILARHTWQVVNLPNLQEHIAPSRRFADVFVEKGPDHRIARIVDRPGGKVGG